MREKWISDDRWNRHLIFLRQVQRSKIFGIVFINSAKNATWMFSVIHWARFAMSAAQEQLWWGSSAFLTILFYPSATITNTRWSNKINTNARIASLIAINVTIKIYAFNAERTTFLILMV